MTEESKPKTKVSLGRPVRDLDEAYRLATALSQSTMLPRELQGSPPNTLMVILWGAELNIGAMQAISSIGIVNGRPVLSGALLLALARRAGHMVEIIENTPKMARVILTRQDDGVTYDMTFDLVDAKRAGLIQVKDGQAWARSEKGKALPWELYTPDLLLWRAVSRAVRFGASEVMLGFLTEEEAESIEEAEVVEEAESPDSATVVHVDTEQVAEEVKALEPAVTMSAAEELQAEREALADQVDAEAFAEYEEQQQLFDEALADDGA